MRIGPPWGGRGHSLKDATVEAKDLPNVRKSMVDGVPAPWGEWDARDLLANGLANNDSVDSWPDRTPNNNPFTQGAGAKQPTFKTNQINGHPAVEFDGSGDLLVNTGVQDDFYPKDQEWQAHVAVAVVQRVAGDGFLYAWANSGDDSPFNGSRVTSGNWEWHCRDDTGSGAQRTFQAADTSWHLQTLVNHTSFGALYQDGSVQGSDDNTSGGDLTATHITLGALKRTSESNQFNCRVAYLGLFPIMSKAELNRLHAALGARYGITVSTIS